MTLVLQGHSYRYGVEQTVMALLPEDKIQRLILWDQEQVDLSQLEGNYVISQRVEDGATQSVTVKTTLYYQGNATVGQVSFSLEEKNQTIAHQYGVKESLFRAIVQVLPAPPPWGSLTGVRPSKMATKVLKERGEQGDAENYLEKTFHLSPQRSQLARRCGEVSLELQEKLPKNGFSLYIGIPFCPTRCSYCSFFSADINENQKLVQPYLDALSQEIAEVGKILTETKIPVTTLYVGGGTPTSLSQEQLEQLLGDVRRHLPLEDCWEFTVEAGRPDTLTQGKFQVLHRYGVDRISINPQTMSDHILENLGRGHNSQDILRAFSQGEGKFSINMDLIAGLPEDTLEGYSHSLAQILALNPQEITVHTLTPKKASPLLTQLESLPQEQMVEAMLQHTWKAMHAQGYRPYYVYRQKKIAGGFENVGWSKPGYLGKYNVIMMEEVQSVVALGAGGMSKTVEQGAISRHSNPKFPLEYTKNIASIIEKKTSFLKEIIRKN